MDVAIKWMNFCGDGRALHVDCTHVSVLVVVLYYTFIRYYHGRELGKGYTDLSIISCNCM